MPENDSIYAPVPAPSPVAEQAPDTAATPVATTAVAAPDSAVAETPAERPAAPRQAEPQAPVAVAHIPSWMLLSREDDAPVALRGEVQYVLPERQNWVDGLAGDDRQLLPGYDSGVMAAILAVVLIVIFNFTRYTTFLKTFALDLWSVRRRSTMFDDHTVSETRVVLSLALLTCVVEATLLFSYAGMQGLPALLQCTALTGTYYIWQVVAYNLTGYAFATTERRVMWVRGFNASQSLLGLTLLPPAIASLFYPAAVPTLVMVGAGLYVAARIVFIVKGFRLFFTTLSTFLYFILYLCALEIAPLAIIAKVVGAVPST